MGDVPTFLCVYDIIILTNLVMPSHCERPFMGHSARGPLYPLRIGLVMSAA